MKIELNTGDTSFKLAFDYPNLVVGTYIPFIWNLNTKLWNNEGRLWNYNLNSGFYLKLVSVYTHKEYTFSGSVNETNNRYTEATFNLYNGDDEFGIVDTEWGVENNEWDYKGEDFILADADDGFYYAYFVVEDQNEAVVIYENMIYIEIEGRKPTFISNISNNETRQIIYAD